MNSEVQQYSSGHKGKGRYACSIYGGIGIVRRAFRPAIGEVHDDCCGQKEEGDADQDNPVTGKAAGHGVIDRHHWADPETMLVRLFFASYMDMHYSFVILLFGFQIIVKYMIFMKTEQRLDY